MRNNILKRNAILTKLKFPFETWAASLFWGSMPLDICLLACLFCGNSGIKIDIHKFTVNLSAMYTTLQGRSEITGNSFKKFTC